MKKQRLRFLVGHEIFITKLNMLNVLNITKYALIYPKLQEELLGYQCSLGCP